MSLRLSFLSFYLSLTLPPSPTFTVSPTIANSQRTSEPTRPVKTRPVVMPTED